MLNAHEHELVGNCQTIYWNEWPMSDDLTKPYIHEFELVDFFSSPVYRQGTYGNYHIYYAVARSKIPELGVRIGDDLILHITFAGWCLALSKVPMEFKLSCRKEVAFGQNLFVKVSRLSHKAMKIHYEERRAPTPEHLEKAKKYYEIINAEHKHNRTY